MSRPTFSPATLDLLPGELARPPLRLLESVAARRTGAPLPRRREKAGWRVRLRQLRRLTRHWLAS